MTKMLASANSLAEAQLLATTQVDIIDLKQPEQGALGALPFDTIKTIVKLIESNQSISATIGDLPMEATLIANAVRQMITTGVDFIKIGFFPGAGWQETLSALNPISQQGHALIAVLFADTAPDIQIIHSIQQAGFSGVMLDTMDKKQGSLTQVMSLRKIQAFVTMAHQAGLFCGLAGSLRAADISHLQQLKANYLGFRGALCYQQQRTDKLDPEAIQHILSCFNRATE